MSGIRSGACLVAAAAGIAMLLIGQQDSGRFRFVQVNAVDSGIQWIHDNARSDSRFLPESLGPGCAFLDYDGDGLQDVFLVNSGPSDFYQPSQNSRNALYRNQGDGTFQDVTEAAGVAGGTFGMGVAVADYDNDGDADLLVTAYGALRLYQNQGDGTFRDVAQRAGLAWSGWTTSAAWFDADLDGYLDVFIGSFVKFDASMGGICGKNSLGLHFYCIPSLFEPTASRLYRNNGDGTFSRADPGTAIAEALGKALGVVADDVDGDGDMDLFVANDTVQNFLFLNHGPDGWEEVGLWAEVAFSADGRARSGMGVDAADWNGDGKSDLFVANVDGEMFSLYQNRGDGTFLDVAFPTGIAEATRLLSGWGLRFADFDLDGAVDLILANGHPDDMIERHRPRVTYREPLLLFAGGSSPRNVSGQAGDPFQERWPARGLAVGDYDNDGRLDVLVGNNGEAPLLLRNRSGAGNHWLGLELVGVRSNRDAIGAKVSWRVGGKTRSLRKVGGGSYLSSHDPRIILGLGAVTSLDWVEIEWPNRERTRQRIEKPALDRYMKVVESVPQPVARSVR
jgi:hypothetical protein